MSPKTGSCMARGPNRSAGRTPAHGAAGCGGRQRRSPTGGAANGMPLKLRTPEPGSMVPSRMPPDTVTRGLVVA